MVAKRHKITNVPLIKKIWDIILVFWDNNFLSYFSGHFEGASTRCARDNLRGQKSLGPLKMSLETAQKVIVPQKKNYVLHFLKQRDINSYFILLLSVRSPLFKTRLDSAFSDAQPTVNFVGMGEGGGVCISSLLRLVTVMLYGRRSL